MKTLGNNDPILCLHGFQQHFYVSKECHFSAGIGTSGYFGELEKKETHPNL